MTDPIQLAPVTGSYRNWRPGAGIPVVTSLTVPRWLPAAASWPRLRAATPRWEYFRAPAGEFAEAYLAQLGRYGIDAIRAELECIVAADGHPDQPVRPVLLCWEKSQDDCHRGLLANWWERQTGQDVPDLSV